VKKDFDEISETVNWQVRILAQVQNQVKIKTLSLVWGQVWTQVFNQIYFQVLEESLNE